MKKTPVSKHVDRELIISESGPKHYLLVTPDLVICAGHTFFERATVGSIVISKEGFWYSWVLNKNNPRDKEKDGSIRYPNDTGWKKQYGRKPPAMVSALAAIYLN